MMNVVPNGTHYMSVYGENSAWIFMEIFKNGRRVYTIPVRNLSLGDFIGVFAFENDGTVGDIFTLFVADGTAGYIESWIVADNDYGEAVSSEIKNIRAMLDSDGGVFGNKT